MNSFILLAFTTQTINLNIQNKEIYKVIDIKITQTSNKRA